MKKEKAADKKREAADADELHARMVAALLHPLRAWIFGILAERPASAPIIAAELQEPPERIGHQLRRLRREGLVHIVERRERRGVAENYYRPTLEPLVDNDEFNALSPAERARLSSDAIKRLYTDATRAVRAGTFDRRSDMCSVHIRMLLDEQGWRELAELHRDAVLKVVALRKQAMDRLEHSATDGIPAASTLFCFELPDFTTVPDAPPST
jgi:DNA-binding transcriptional ArsR family regulator